MIRFVLDETSWSHLTSKAPQQVHEELEALIERLEAASARREKVARSQDFYSFPAGPEVDLATYLFGNPNLDRDLRFRLQRHVDKISCWDEEVTPDSLEVGLRTLDNRLYAPSIAFSHMEAGQGRGVACLALPGSQRSGLVAVFDGAIRREIHFVTDERQHRDFFRWVIEFERATLEGYESLALSAFPDLAWAERLWSGLSDFSRSFSEIRPILTRHLAVLDDHGAAIFREFLGSQPAEIGTRLSAHGAEASDENGKTKQNPQAVKNRTRTFGGLDQVFFWHTKLHPHENRVHFLYETSRDRIIVGLFTRHCDP